MSPDDMLTFMPFARAAGVELIAARKDEVVGRLSWAAERTTAGGMLHGGAIMTLADSTGAVCAFLNLPDGARTSTISSSTVFTGAVRSGAVTATSTPLHVGRTTIAVRTDLADDSGRYVAHVTQIQAVLMNGGGVAGSEG
ncbi:MAG TPA: PaaI family thioesterase [Jatrophihabitantaceae bacterium]